MSRGKFLLPIASGHHLDTGESWCADRRSADKGQKGTTGNVETVSFKNKAEEIAGHLHLPDDFDKEKKYPALVGVHPAGGVKEQTIGQYAKRLAAHGFVTVVYDSS